MSDISPHPSEQKYPVAKKLITDSTGLEPVTV